MNRTLKNLLILLFFAILWTCKPISYQDLVRNQSIREKTSPNIFDTRESFLKKMNNPEMRTNFLNSYNNRFKKNN